MKRFSVKYHLISMCMANFYKDHVVTSLLSGSRGRNVELIRCYNKETIHNRHPKATTNPRHCLSIKFLQVAHPYMYVRPQMRIAMTECPRKNYVSFYYCTAYSQKPRSSRNLSYTVRVKIGAYRSIRKRPWIKTTRKLIKVAQRTILYTCAPSI